MIKWLHSFFALTPNGHHGCAMRLCVSVLEDQGMAFFNLRLGVSPLLATQNTAATIPLSTLGPSEYMCSRRRAHCIYISPCALLAVASITCTAFSAVVKIHFEEFSLLLLFLSLSFSDCSQCRLRVVSCADYPAPPGHCSLVLKNPFCAIVRQESHTWLALNLCNQYQNYTHGWKPVRGDAFFCSLGELIL